MAKELSMRHIWERTGPEHAHTKECGKCGCIKQSIQTGNIDNAQFSTKYILDGSEYFTYAPKCDNRLLKTTSISL